MSKLPIFLLVIFIFVSIGSYTYYILVNPTIQQDKKDLISELELKEEIITAFKNHKNVQYAKLYSSSANQIETLSVALCKKQFPNWITQYGDCALSEFSFVHLSQLNKKYDYVIKEMVRLQNEQESK